MTSTPAKQLYDAVVKGDVQAVTRLAKKFGSVDLPYAKTATDSQYAPISIAATKGRLEVVQALIDAGADVNFRDLAPTEPKPNFQYNLSTPLMYAAQAGAADVVQTLIDHGADIRQVNAHGDTALLWAIAYCDGKPHFRVIETLAKAGVKPTLTAPRKGCSYLVRAASRGGIQYRRGLIKTLVDCGADPNLPCGQKAILPLQEAVAAGGVKTVGELLECGADPNLAAPKSKGHPWSGLTALEYAKAIGCKQAILDLLQSGVPSAKTSARKGVAKKASKSGTVPTAEKSWTAIEKGLEKHDKPMLKSLAKGATAAAVSKLVGKTKIRLTNEVKEFFQRHNGQSGSRGLLVEESTGEEFILLSVDRVIQEWTAWEELASMGEFEDAEAIAQTGVRECWWHAKWLPFASNTAGDFLCFDLSPGKGGKVGQVITLWHADAGRNIVYDSIRTMLAAIAQRVGA